MERKQVTLFPSFNIRLCFCFYKYGQKYDPYLWLLPLQCHARVSKCCGEEKCSLDRWGCGPYRAILGAKEHSALHIRPFMWPSLAASCSDICMHNLQGQVSALMRCKELIILAQEKYFMKYSMQIRALDYYFTKSRRWLKIWRKNNVLRYSISRPQTILRGQNLPLVWFLVATWRVRLFPHGLCYTHPSVRESDPKMRKHL